MGFFGQDIVMSYRLTVFLTEQIRAYLCPILPQSHESLLHVVRARMDGEEVRAGVGGSEDAGLGVHATAKVGQAAFIKR